MQSAGIKELKNNLSRYLARVKQGEEVLVTERGKIIARIIAEKPEKVSLLQGLQSMVADGIGIMPTRELNRKGPDRLAVKGRPVSEIVIEDRR